jgi:hypothetical protein
LECDIAKTRKLAQDAKGTNELYECKTFANDLKTKMQKTELKERKLPLKHLRLKVKPVIFGVINMESIYQPMENIKQYK